MGIFVVTDRGVRKRYPNSISTEAPTMLFQSMFTGLVYPSTWYYTVIYHNAQGTDTLNPTTNPTLLTAGTPTPNIDPNAGGIFGGQDTFLNRNGSWYEWANPSGLRTPAGSPVFGTGLLSDTISTQQGYISFPETLMPMPTETTFTGVNALTGLTETFSITDPAKVWTICLVNSPDVGDNNCNMFASFNLVKPCAGSIGMSYTFALADL